MGLPVVESQSRVSLLKGKMVPIVAVNAKREKPKIRPRESRQCFEKDERDAPENDGTWQENIVVCMAPGDPSRLILRSYYNNSQTSQEVWDDPPPDALHVKDASADMVRHAMLKLKNHQEIIKCLHNSIEPSPTHDTEQSSVSHASSTGPAPTKQPQKFGLFTRKICNQETTFPEVQPMVEKGDHEKKENGNPVEGFHQEDVWKERLAACISPGGPTKLILRSCFISNLTGKVVWNRPLKGTKVQYVSDNARQKAQLNMKEKEGNNRSMFEEKGTSKLQTKKSSLSSRSKRKLRSKAKKIATSKARGFTTSNEELFFLQVLEGCSPVIGDDVWSRTMMMNLAMGESAFSDYDGDDDEHMDENLNITTSSSTLLASNRTDIVTSFYQAFKDAIQQWLGQWSARGPKEDEEYDYPVQNYPLSTVASEPQAFDSHWAESDSSTEQSLTGGCDFFNSLCNYNTAIFDYATARTERICFPR